MERRISIHVALSLVILFMSGQLVTAADLSVQSNILNQGTVVRSPSNLRVSTGIDFCVIQYPQKIAVQPGMFTGSIYGRVYKSGITETQGPNPLVAAELGYGPARTDPRSATGWVFIKGAYSTQVGSNDEYVASFTAPATGSYAYCWRFSLNGTNWTYADIDGVDPSRGLSFDPSKLGELISQ
jgi:hypothetical protein